MTWADSVPNLLIGLREGLEAGLVVSILLAALHKLAPAGVRGLTAPIWLGVLGAVSVAGAFAAVLTFSVSVLSSAGQEAVSGLLSVFAVCLVTGMIFWMRRTASRLSAHLKGEVAHAVAIGAGALTITAFLAVGREGLETTLFLWTAARASGQTVAPLGGAAIGIAAAVALCWLLYRRAIHLNVGVFFNRTAIALIVIAAGVLAAGLGDLQESGLLPGHSWIAFDLTAHIDPGSWWASIITGITELTPKMTVLQVAAWLAYLAVVIPAFVTAGRPAAAASPAGQRPAAETAPAAGAAPAGPTRWERLAGGRPWAVAGVLVAVPALAAGTAVGLLPAASAGAPMTVTVSRTDCAPEWTSGTPGTHTFTVTNSSDLVGEINLVNAAGAVAGEIETIGPDTSAQLTATLGSGAYTFRCLMGSRAAITSQPVQVTGNTGTGNTGAATQDPVAVRQVTVGDLTAPNDRYRAYAAAQLANLAGDVAKIQADLRRGDMALARQDWLGAQLDWERVGASYNSFGDLGIAVDGLPDGLRNGVADKNFQGLHRLEYGLWHGHSAAVLQQVTVTLAGNVAAVRKNLGSEDLAGDPANLPVRAHEIIEDALRDHLSGMDDQGGGAAFAQTYAGTQVTRVLLGYLAPLIDARQPGLVATITAQLDSLQQALLATRAGGAWPSLAAAPLSAREHVNAATGALLETVAAVPDLLEVPPAH